MINRLYTSRKCTKTREKYFEISFLLWKNEKKFREFFLHNGEKYFVCNWYITYTKGGFFLFGSRTLSLHYNYTIYYARANLQTYTCNKQNKQTNKNVTIYLKKKKISIHKNLHRNIYSNCKRKVYFFILKNNFFLEQKTKKKITNNLKKTDWQTFFLRNVRRQDCFRLIW